MSTSRDHLSAEGDDLDVLVAEVASQWDPELADPRHTVTLGRYMLNCELGRGTYGVVFMARDIELQRPVAVKVYRWRRCEAENLNEAQTLARLRHPNIIAVHDLGRARGFTYLVQELILGETLAERMHTEVSWGALLKLFIQAGRGLAAVHAAGIAHGDVKPSNILVDCDGQVRLIDFGFSRPLLRATSRLDWRFDVIPISDLRGTSQYMAPERWLRVADEWSDQFSFCVSLWEAIYGCRPWPSAETCVCEGEPARGDAAVQIPAELDRILRRGLAPEPDDRFERMTLLVDALTRILPSEPPTGAAGAEASRHLRRFDPIR